MLCLAICAFLYCGPTPVEVYPFHYLNWLIYTESYFIEYEFVQKRVA